MALQVDIEKNLGPFQLRVQFDAENETLALLGASGSGKSLTLKCVAGIVKPDRGRIVLDGRVLFDSKAKIDLPPQQRQVGYMFQQYALFPTMTVEQNLTAGLHGLPRGRRKAEIARLLDRFRLNGLEKKLPGQLSGGEQQRVALARILASRPQAILLDEPFSALDSYLKWSLELELDELLSDFSGSILWVSHDRGEAYRHCGRVCVMHRGRSSPVMTMDQLFHDPGTVSAARLAGCKNFVGCQVTAEGVRVPAWNRTFRCSHLWPDAEVLGIPAAAISLNGADNPLPCRVTRVLEDVSATILLAQPEGSEGEPLRVELPKENRYQADDRIQLSLSPDGLLLLTNT